MTSESRQHVIKPLALGTVIWHTGTTIPNALATTARVEHEKALARAMLSVMKDDTQLFKMFSDNDGFRRWISDMTYGIVSSGGDGPRPAA